MIIHHIRSNLNNIYSCSMYLFFSSVLICNVNCDNTNENKHIICTSRILYKLEEIELGDA